MISTTTIYSSHMKGRKGKRKERKRKGRGKRQEEKERGQDRQEKYFFFFPFAKRRGNSEVSANNVINRISLY